MEVVQGRNKEVGRARGKGRSLELGCRTARAAPMSAGPEIGCAVPLIPGREEEGERGERRGKQKRRVSDGESQHVPTEEPELGTETGQISIESHRQRQGEKRTESRKEDRMMERSVGVGK